MHDTLRDGYVYDEDVQLMRQGMRATGRHRAAFGAERWDELNGLLKQVEALPRVSPPIINHRPGAWHHHVPYPYQFKWDGPWVFVACLVAFGFITPGLWLLAGFIAFMRGLIWCSFRFPMTTTFFVGFFSGLLGGRR